MGLLMVLFPPRVAIPRRWWLLAGLFLLLGLGPFLPAAWFEVPGWRRSLESLGVATGPHVAIQWRQAIEQYIVFAVVLVTGLWMTGHRVAAPSSKNLALAFVMGVAVYALLAEFLKDMLPVRTYRDHFGFFPNRNHSGTYLAVGATCGLGVGLQALRNKQFWRMGIGLAATAICVWAAFAWSISRAGVMLTAVGFVVWAGLLGRKYWGGNEMKAVALIALLAAGAFSVAETRVKTRIETTTGKIATATGESASTAFGAPENGVDGPPGQQVNDVDFRIPIALDTFQMIKAEPWTGVGAGQFKFVFPQYRRLSATVNDSECLHPEGDWLWMAAELGIPATVVLAALVLSAFAYGFKNVLAGRDRALRMGLLVAAMLVPLHGCFDVPGHRPVLAWTSVFLFVLALHPPQSLQPRTTRKWMLRCIGILILLTGLRLSCAPWFGFAPPYTVKVTEQFDHATSAYRLVVAAGPQATSPAIELQRHQILKLVEDALEYAPLEHQLHYLRGLTLMPAAGRRDEVDRAFKVERSLAPMWVKLPHQQASAWIPYDLARVSSLWRESLRISREIDRITPNSAYSFEKTSALIRRSVRKNPILQQVAEDAIRFAANP
jgi:O-antigen ligase